MKRLFLLVIFLFPNFPCGRSSAENTLMDALTMSIAQVSPSGTVTLEVINSSKEPIKLFKESNSWGAARWCVLLIRNGNLEVFYQSLNQIFTRNIPTFNEIAGGSHFDKKLDVNGGDWRGIRGKKLTFESGDMIIAIYDVPATTEARKLGVWYGVAAALTTVR